MKKAGDGEGGSEQVGPGGRCSGRRRTAEAAGLERAGSPGKVGGRPRTPRGRGGASSWGLAPGGECAAAARRACAPEAVAGREGARLGRPPAPGAPPGTYHLGDLEAAERAAQVVGVAAQAGQPAALAHRLGGGLVRAAGARDHGGARGLALEAVQLLAAPHAAARPGPPRAAGPRRPELAGSAGPPHRRRRLPDRPRPAPPPPPPLRPPPGCSRGSVRSGSAPAASAAEREGGGSRRRGKEAGAGAAGREGAERVPTRRPLGGAPRLGRDGGGGPRLGASGGGASGAGREGGAPSPRTPPSPACAQGPEGPAPKSCDPRVPGRGS